MIDKMRAAMRALSGPSPRAKGLVDLLVTLATGVAALSLIWHLWAGSTERPEPPEPPRVEDVTGLELSLAIGGAARRGSPTAPIALVEFADFECPFCARHAGETFERLEREFLQAGRVEYVVKHFPLDVIHPSARMAAAAAVCAHGQGQFWEMRRGLFANRPRLALGNWREVAPDVDLEWSQFEACLRDAGPSIVELDVQEGVRLGISSTPTFLIARRDVGDQLTVTGLLRGAAPYAVFEDGLRRAWDAVRRD